MIIWDLLLNLYVWVIEFLYFLLYWLTRFLQLSSSFNSIICKKKKSISYFCWCPWWRTGNTFSKFLIFLYLLRFLLIDVFNKFLINLDWYLRITNFTYTYVNVDLKISVYVCVHIKTLPWKFCILNPKNSRVVIP